MNAKTSRQTDDESSQLDAAAILLSLKTSPPCFPQPSATGLSNDGNRKSTSTGYIPLYDWTQAIPSLSYAGNTYNINLQMYNSPIRLVPVPLNDKNSNSYKEMSVAFVKFCQIHRDTILLRNPALTVDKVNEKLVQLWTQLSDDEKVVYSKVAKNEMLLMQGQDISSTEGHIKVEPRPEELYDHTIEKGSPSLFRHPIFSAAAIPPKQYKPEVKDSGAKQGQKSPKVIKLKQRSVSLSENNSNRIYIRRAISQEEIREKGPGFAKPDLPENRKYYSRIRRHSMNDSILSTEKINPYFTKNYSKSPHKIRQDYSGKSNQLIHSPKRNLSVTSIDNDHNNSSKSPLKKNKNVTAEPDIFDFNSEVIGSHLKCESGDECHAEDSRKTETYSYSLLKGASKTSSVNPSFSSRKMFVKKMNSLPSKCMNKIKQEYCNKLNRSTGSEKHSPSIVKFNYNSPELTRVISPNSSPYDHHTLYRGNCSGNYDRVAMRKEADKSPTLSVATSDVTMVTSSSVNSFVSPGSSCSSNESGKLEGLNDSVLLSHAIAESENAELSRLKGSRRSNSNTGSQSSSDMKHRHVYKFFREFGLNPTPEQIQAFYLKHKETFICKSSALLTIREVKQKIIKLQLM